MYNFYNEVMNRAVESYWRAQEGNRNWTQGDRIAAMKQYRTAMIGGFVALVMPAVIHNLVDPPKTDEKDSPVMKGFKYVVHPYSAFFPFIRDLVPFIMGEESPNVGLLTSAYEQAGQLPKDIVDGHAMDTPAHKEKLIRDGSTFLGLTTGVPGSQLGRWAGGLYGMATGQEQPQGLVGLHDMVRFGTTKGHARTLQEYLQGGYDRRE
jgi:hypothetical protein